MIVTRCGCYIWRDNLPRYLPQVSVKAHATLFSSTSHTTLTQDFVNPSKDTGLDEVNYTFPLYDGVSVVGFTCRIGDRVIKGVVKEREQAKKDYDKAKANEQFAGLLQRSEKSADVFTTSLGNVPAGASVSVEMTYLGELKHDAEVDGLRYVLPTIIAPRYGPSESFPGSDNVKKADMSITVDAEMPSAIKSLQSPSHSVSVNIGATSVDPDAEPSFQRASASLALSTAALEKDFVLQVVAADLSLPSAMMETHPDRPNQRALMATLVPKFSLPPIKPEIVFLCDRSGSMGGRIDDLVSALRIFLKSIPAGTKFNICSFGTSFSFLWEKSASYTEKSLNEALEHVAGFSANYGGTNISGAMKDTFKRRYGDIELEVIMLTDGQIWDQDNLFTMIREEVASSAGAVRVFTLGVGSGASSALVEGAARAGNGASQIVVEGEKMDKKVIRTLKACLSPHVLDYTLEIKYEKDDDDDFELVEKINAVSIDTDLAMAEEPSEAKSEEKPTISLFDPSHKDDTTIPEPPSVKDKYASLPPLPPPSYLQAPYKMPPLFAFNRTTVYVLLSDATPERHAKSVVLRATSQHGPLELEIPIQHLEKKGRAIHQLAARKAVQDLESDGGWLNDAHYRSGQKLKEAKSSIFDDMVEREAVRLGVEFQVGGKWCSFVAVDEDDEKKDTPSNAEMMTVQPSGEPMEQSLPFLGYTFKRFDTHHQGYQAAQSFEMARRSFASTAGPAPRRQLASKAYRKAPSAPEVQEEEENLIDYSDEDLDVDIGMDKDRVVHEDMFLQEDEPDVSENAFGATRPLSMEAFVSEEVEQENSPARKHKKKKIAHDEPVSLSEALHKLVALQSFTGSWKWTTELEHIISGQGQHLKALGWPGCADEETKDAVSATVCVIMFFRKKLAAEKETWEMVVEKAQEYLKATTGQSVEELDKIASKAYQV